MAAGALRPADAGQGGTLRVAVAVSGGVDSSALLHATRAWARPLGAEVHALHVHHGLQADATRWMHAVSERCRRWGVVFHGTRLQSAPQPGDSVEAWARRERYAALAAMARAAGCDIVLLAHHARDQAETVLLQALRGAGPAGLAAMPRVAERDGLTWARPWLQVPREQVLAYARRHRLGAVQDPSNVDDRHARSRLRTRVWPGLLQAFGDAETALQAVARRAHEARQVLDEVASADAAQVLVDGGLQLPRWLGLSDARRANVLRHWLAQPGGHGVPETLVQRLLHELPGARSGSWPFGPRTLRLHRGVLRAVDVRDGPQAAAPPPTLVLDLRDPGLHRLPAPWGDLRVRRARSGGVPQVRLAQVQLRARAGGEQFQSHTGGLPRSLKKQFQAAGVPAWERDGPLLCVDGQLIWVAALGLDARAEAWAGSPRVCIDWVRPGGVSGSEASAD